jgi:hypothetical protein
MKVKGSKVHDAIVSIYYVGYKKLGESKIEHGDRGSAIVTANEARQEKQEVITFNPSSQWAKVKKEFTPKLENKKLADLTEVRWWIYILFALSPGREGGTLYIDDVKITEK